MADDRSKIQLTLWRTRWILLAAVLVAGCLHFVRPPKSDVWYRVKIAGPVVYAFNPDSPNFARIVVKFPKGLNDSPQGRTRLMRPVYPAAAWCVYQPMRLFKGLVPNGLASRVAAKMTEANHPELWEGVDPAEIVLAWGALVIVNVAVLWLSLILVHRALREIFEPACALLLTLSVAFHFVTIRYVYVPHTEPFDLLIPAIFLDAAARVWTAGRSGWTGAIALGACLPAKSIAYPAANWIYEHLHERRWKEGWKRAAALALVIAAPTALYILLLTGLGIRPTSYAVTHYRQVVWMADYVHEGRALEIPLRWLTGLGRHIGFTLWGFAPALVVMIALGSMGRRRGGVKVPDKLWRHLIVFAVSGAIFWMLVGWINLRLTVCHYPVVLVALGALTMGRSGRPCRWLAGVLAGEVALFAAGAFG